MRIRDLNVLRVAEILGWRAGLAFSLRYLTSPVPTARTADPWSYRLANASLGGLRAAEN